jgi:hypothetical protein
MHSGIYPAFPGNVTWLSVNLAGDYKRAAGMAIYIGLGNLAGGEFWQFIQSDEAVTNEQPFSHGFELLSHTGRTAIHPRSLSGTWVRDRGHDRDCDHATYVPAHQSE